MTRTHRDGEIVECNQVRNHSLLIWTFWVWEIVNNRIEKKEDHVLDTRKCHDSSCHLIDGIKGKRWLMFDTIVELLFTEMFSIIMWMLSEWWLILSDIEDDDAGEWTIGRRRVRWQFECYLTGNWCLVILTMTMSMSGRFSKGVFDDNVNIVRLMIDV